MNSTDTGRRAEKAAATYLEMRGYEIVERNWRRPRCEIDIIAKKEGVIYFVEVKYRRNNNQGSGLEYITASKQKQMQFAAFNWVSETKWRGDFRLAAVEVGGPSFAIMNFIDNVI